MLCWKLGRAVSDEAREPTWTEIRHTPKAHKRQVSKISSSEDLCLPYPTSLPRIEKGYAKVHSLYHHSDNSSLVTEINNTDTLGASGTFSTRITRKFQCKSGQQHSLLRSSNWKLSSAFWNLRKITRFLRIWNKFSHFPVFQNECSSQRGPEASCGLNRGTPCGEIWSSGRISVTNGERLELKFLKKSLPPWLDSWGQFAMRTKRLM